MVSAGMPELLLEKDIHYLRDKLAIGLTEKAANATFHAEVSKSLDSTYRRIDNWVLHCTATTPALSLARVLTRLCVIDSQPQTRILNSVLLSSVSCSYPPPAPPACLYHPACITCLHYLPTCTYPSALFYLVFSFL